MYTTKECITGLILVIGTITLLAFICAVSIKINNRTMDKATIEVANDLEKQVSEAEKDPNRQHILNIKIPLNDTILHFINAKDWKVISLSANS